MNPNTDDLQKKLDRIERKLDFIITILHHDNKDIKENCKKMGNHIQFIENVYDSVRTPLNYLTNKVNYMLGNKNESTSLPIKQIENTNIEDTNIEDSNIEDTNDDKTNTQSDISFNKSDNHERNHTNTEKLYPSPYMIPMPSKHASFNHSNYIISNNITTNTNVYNEDDERKSISPTHKKSND